MATYINYRFMFAQGRWQLREFALRWWKIYGSDPRWVPPIWTEWRRAIGGDRCKHLARMQIFLLHGEALPRQKPVASPGHLDAGAITNGLFEEPVAAGMIAIDPRRKDGTAYVVWLHLVNNAESLDRFLWTAQEQLIQYGIQRLVLPTGLSPHLQTGVLQDYFHLLPPLYTPYNPPYVPELFAVGTRPVGSSQLYTVATDQVSDAHESSGPAEIRPLEPRRLAGDLLPLFQLATPEWAGFPPPDKAEVLFILRWIDRWKLRGWLAVVEGAPVGFVLLQADRALIHHSQDGGRRLWRRLWMRWLSRRPARSGRLLFGAVDQNWRGQGIGRQLWSRALQTASQAGWRQLSIGPLPATAIGRGFLERYGATPQQSYLLHRYDFR